MDNFFSVNELVELSDWVWGFRLAVTWFLVLGSNRSCRVLSVVSGRAGRAGRVGGVGHVGRVVWITQTIFH